MAIGRMPSSVEPYDQWHAHQQVMIWGQHPRNGYGSDRAPLKVGRVKRMTKTLVVLVDDSRWQRSTGVTVDSSGSEWRTTPDRYIVPLVQEDHDELKRLRQAHNLKTRLEQIDLYAMDVADLVTLDTLVHKCREKGWLKKRDDDPVRQKDRA